MSTTTVVATCSLNQWAMDFSANYDRIRDSILQCRKLSARYRVGPELEVCGYGCEDHFLELDTFVHSWEIIARILQQNLSDNILLDIGAPVLHNKVPYNSRVFLLNGDVILIRPKTDLADDGNYRESRWFRAWPAKASLEHYALPPFVRAVTRSNAKHVPFGTALLTSIDGVNIASETCEELWTPLPSHASAYVNGADIVANGSASHHVLRKLDARLALIVNATRSAGGAYLYANQIGCDGGRLYYDGGALIALNGNIVRQTPQFCLEKEVFVEAAPIDISDITQFRLARTAASVQTCREMTQRNSVMNRIYLPDNFEMCVSKQQAAQMHAAEIKRVRNVKLHSAEEEIAKGPACWLWDYLRRSGMNGFFLALSGGADSASVAAIVGSMCQMLVEAVSKSNCEMRLLKDIRKVAAVDEDEEYVAKCSKELAGRIFYTAYMSCGSCSSEETRSRARNIAEQIGARHANFGITAVVNALLELLPLAYGKSNCTPKFSNEGGSRRENLALQNVQARVRMATAYLFAQLAPWANGRRGSLLVLGAGNVDEALRGYLTKYDCSSADINPIGGICKADLKRFLKWAGQDHGLGFKSLLDVERAAPTAELMPIVINGDGGGGAESDELRQTDEADMGMTYAELERYGRLRKLAKCGPVSMYRKLAAEWANVCSVHEIAEKVKYFFRMYAMNRHKMTTLTPSYHAEDYSPEDNRFDLRQFLYNIAWPWQFAKIDEAVASTADNEHLS